VTDHHHHDDAGAHDVHRHEAHVHGHDTHEHRPHDAGGRPHPHDHEHRGGLIGFVAGLIRPHSHDHADSLDDAVMASKAGTRALAISLSGLAVTAVIQFVVYAASSSVGLLADTVHNFADALTAVPIGLAFVVARLAPTRRYTYGFGRAEDLAGLSVVLVMAASAAVTTWEAVVRLLHPHRVTDLGWVAAAGVVGFVGNELAARYRIRVGRQIGSAALVADGHHARTDGFTSLAVVVGAGGVAIGWRQADPIVGLLITVAILGVLRGAARDVYRRLMDGVDPDLVEQVDHFAARVPGVVCVDDVRVRWVGHELRAELNVTVDRDLHVFQAHAVAEEVRHTLLHHIPRLADAKIHTDPSTTGDDPHALTAHHYAQATEHGHNLPVR
jgi:cation diffusion facilitator family transporter